MQQRPSGVFCLCTPPFGLQRGIRSGFRGSLGKDSSPFRQPRRLPSRPALDPNSNVYINKVIKETGEELCMPAEVDLPKSRLQIYYSQMKRWNITRRRLSFVCFNVLITDFGNMVLSQWIAYHIWVRVRPCLQLASAAASQTRLGSTTLPSFSYSLSVRALTRFLVDNDQPDPNFVLLCIPPSFDPSSYTSRVFGIWKASTSPQIGCSYVETDYPVVLRVLWLPIHIFRKGFCIRSLLSPLMRKP
jgi:hypothetical protein